MIEVFNRQGVSVAKHRVRQSRQIGLEPNMLCPHCNRKVKQCIELKAGYFVEHWWSKMVCSNYTMPPGEIERVMEAQFKRNRYTIKRVDEIEPA